MNSTLKTLTLLTTGSIVLGYGLGWSSAAKAANLTVQTIDPFNVNQFVSNVGAAIGPNTTAITSSLLGNSSRTISGNITQGSTSGNSVTVDVNDSLPGAFAVANGPGRRSNINTSYAFTGPRDFTVGGVADRILLEILENDTPMTIVFNFTDADGTMGSLTSMTPGGISSSPLSLSLLFSSAVISAPGSTAGLNFASITGFNFSTNANLNNSSDIILDFVSVGREMPMDNTTIPEPGTLLGLGSIAVLGLFGRKKKSDNA